MYGIKSYRRRGLLLNGTTLFVAGLLVVLLIAVLYSAFTYKKEKYVTIKDRWWVSRTRVLYDDYECDIGLDSEGNLTRDCGWETYTRCISDKIGRSVPVIAPEPSCGVRRGDYVRVSNDFYIAYQEEETQDTGKSRIHEYQWDGLAPGSRVKLVLGLFGSVKEFE